MGEESANGPGIALINEERTLLTLGALALLLE